MVQMNSHIFTAFLQACTAVPLAPHQVEAVFGAMVSYRACQPPTAFVYTSLLTFCAKQAPERALDVWHAMHEVSPSPPASSPLRSSTLAVIESRVKHGVCLSAQEHADALLSSMLKTQLGNRGWHCASSDQA